MANYRIISSDSHIFEPRDLWSSRIEPKYKDRAPVILREGGLRLLVLRWDKGVGSPTRRTDGQAVRGPGEP